MKGGVYQGKKRWRCLAIGVLFLVILSMLVPFLFLLGPYTASHFSSSSRFVSDKPSSTSISDIPAKLADEAKKEFISSTTIIRSPPQKGVPVLSPAVRLPLPSENKSRVGGVSKVVRPKKSPDKSDTLCELRYGSYCLWRDEHREDMKDHMVKKLKDQLFVARAYFPNIAKLPAQSKLSHEMKQNIQDLEHIFSQSTTDADLPPRVEKKLQKIEASVARAKEIVLDCSNVDKKLRQIYDMTEDEANFHKKQSAFLYQLAVQTTPKGLHCLSMRLTLEFFKSSLHEDLAASEKYSDPTLQHYIIFSNNVLASSVVINSTVTHARDSRDLVFHILTNEQNFFAMRYWFFRNTYREATIQVLDVDHLNLDYPGKEALSRMSMPIEFRISFHTIDNTLGAHIKTEYVSVFSHAHYLLPYIFPKLKKVVVLEDDVVVQRDLSDLWSLNMEGKVNGAVELCSVQLAQLQSYMGENVSGKSSCAWMSGLNIIDFDRWKELDLTNTYQKLFQKVGKIAGSMEVATFSASLLTFQNKIYALDNDWALSGLGHDYRYDVQEMKKATVLHYNGQMKPWLELGIPRYKQFWKRYLNREDRLLGECNLNT